MGMYRLLSFVSALKWDLITEQAGIQTGISLAGLQSLHQALRVQKVFTESLNH